MGYNVKKVEKLVKKRNVKGLIRALHYKKDGDFNDGAVRRNAADALGRIGDAQAVEPLIAALEDEEWEVRSYAERALGNIGDARAVEPLIVALEDGLDWISESAAYALGKIGDARAVEPLIAALVYGDYHVNPYAAYALGEFGDARAVEPLIDALGRIGDTEPVVIDPMLGEHHVHAAVWALGKIGTPAVGPLIKALKDKNIRRREKAAEALVEIGAPAVKPLISTLKDKNKDVRRASAYVLGKIGDARAVEPLIAALEGAESDMSKIVVNALHEIGSPAEKPLTAALKHNGEGVRKHAAAALRKIRETRKIKAAYAQAVQTFGVFPNISQ